MQGESTSASSDGLITILLATYNGEQFVAEQIESFFRQTYTKWCVVARDDGSSDCSPNILADYASRFPGKFIVDTAMPGNLGFAANFARLMELAQSNWFMFSDQDDVWNAEKLEIYAAKMRKMESKYGVETPILLYSLVDVVDKYLNSSEENKYYKSSLMKSSDILNVTRNNVAMGSTSMGNAALRRLAAPLPPGIEYHDWWAALVAAACGKLELINYRSMLYRQHGANTVGAYGVEMPWIWLRKPHWKIATMRRHRNGKNMLISDFQNRRKTMALRREQTVILEQYLKPHFTRLAAAKINFVLYGRGPLRALYSVWDMLNY